MVGQPIQTTAQYGVKITTVDPAQGMIQGVFKGDSRQRSLDIYTTGLAFRWPVVGESWMAEQKNGIWYLNGLWPTISAPLSFKAIEPGDLVLNAPTGRIYVLGSDDGLTDGVVGSTVLPLPTPNADNTDVINAAVAQGRTLGPGTFYVNGVVDGPFSGSGSAKTIISLGAQGTLRWGPPLGQAPVQMSGDYGGFTVQGQGLASICLSHNGVLTNLSDIVANGGTIASLALWGQNGELHRVAADSISFDNGCGGYEVHVEAHGPDASLPIVTFQQTVAPPNGSYAVPSSNFLIGGINEFSPAAGTCVTHYAGSQNVFDLWNFFTNSNVALVDIVSRGLPDEIINDALYFRDCFWTGNGVGSTQIGIRCVHLDASGNAASLPGGDVPVILEGVNKFSGLASAVTWGVTNQCWNIGLNRLYNGTVEFTRAAPGAPITFNTPRDDGHNPPLRNGWTNVRTPKIYRDRGRAYLSGAITGGTLGVVALDLTTVSGYQPGQDVRFAVPANGAFGEVVVTATGQVIVISGTGPISLDSINFEHTTY